MSDDRPRKPEDIMIEMITKELAKPGHAVEASAVLQALVSSECMAFSVVAAGLRSYAGRDASEAQLWLAQRKLAERCRASVMRYTLGGT